MRPSQALALHRAQIRQMALSHRVQDIRVFGSTARGGDSDDSDLDLLVEPTSETTLLDIGAIRVELKQLLGLGKRWRFPRHSPPALTSMYSGGRTNMRTKGKRSVG